LSPDPNMFWIISNVIGITSRALLESYRAGIMIDATAIILTKNEEKNIVDCLSSLKGFVKRCVVVDCGSVDKTVELAKQYDADVYFHEFEYYARQFNWALANVDITTEWVVRIDADESFPPELCGEIEKVIDKTKGSDVNGITIQAELFFLGRLMKHGNKTKRKTMLFKKAYGRIEDRRRDAHSVLSEGRTVSVNNRFIHRDFKNLERFSQRYIEYAEREALDYFDYVNGQAVTINTDKVIMAKRRKKFGVYYRMPRLFRAWLWFLYIYIFRLGFLDGKEGFIFYFLGCYWYRTLVDAKIIEMEKSGKNVNV